MWLERLPAQLHYKVREHWQRAARRLNGEIQVGTACSSTDLAIKVMNSVARMLAHESQIDIKIRHVFGAEKNQTRRLFVLQNHDPPPEKLFADVADLMATMAFCTIAKKPVIVSHCHLLIAGFSCKSRSKANNRRKEFSMCLQMEIPCETTMTWLPLKKYISDSQPLAAILEHVDELYDVCVENGVSDVDHILSFLREQNYFAQDLRMQADRFGSATHRKRLYIIAVRIDPHVQHSSLSQFLMTILNSMEIGQGKLSDFIDLEGSEGATMRTMKAPKGDMKYKDEHIEYFQTAGLQWPVNTDETAQQLIDTRLMTERQIEVSVYVNAMHPPPAMLVAPQFCDINPSLSRIVGPHKAAVDQRIPWSDVVPTLTTSSAILARYGCDKQTGSDGHETCKLNCKLRLLHGAELMRLMGWDGDIRVETEAEEHRELTAMAGDAFSAFSIGPVFLLTLAALGAEANIPNIPDQVASAEGVDEADTQLESDSSSPWSPGADSVPNLD